MADARTIPLLSHGAGDRVAFRGGQPVHREAYLTHVRRLAEQLPNAPFAINLCENRYSFMIALAAAMLRGQTTLLPPARTRKVVEELAADYAGSYCLLDSPFEAEGIEQHIVSPDRSSTTSASSLESNRRRQISRAPE